MKTSKFKIIFVALAFLVSSFASVAHGQTETPPKPSEPHVATIPTPVEKTLSNGLRVIVVERKNVPLVTARLMIKSGGEVDPNNLAGAADMTAELLTKGTKTRTATQIAEEMEFLGGAIDSGAAWDFSNVTFRVMSDKLDKAMAIAADSVLNPTFSQEEIDRYKTQTLDELTVNLKEPSVLASYVANRVVFSDEGYGHPLSGTPESLGQIKQQDLIKIHSSYYKPNNSILIIAGDITPSNAFALAEKHFGKWVKAAPAEAKMTTRVGGHISDKLNLDKITVVDLPGSGQAAVFVAKFGIDRSSPLYYQLTVANSILNGYSARLNQEIRIKRGLSYGAGSSLASRRDGGIFTTRAQTKNESAAEVAEIMVHELNRLASESVGDVELTPRKAALTGNFSRELETTGGLVNQISQLALYNLPLSQINSYIQSVQSVNNNGIQSGIKEFYGETTAQIVIVGDAKQFLPDLKTRFPSSQINLIPAAELDLGSAMLRKSK